MKIKNFKTLKDINFDNKKVICRLDLNVPIKDGEITDSKRIDAALPTLKYLLDHNCSIIVLSHLSRIKTLKDKKSGKKSLKLVASYMKDKLQDLAKVDFCNENYSKKVKDLADKLLPKQILVLENTRYNDVNDKDQVVKLESKNDPKLGKFWASLADIFVNDAFGTAHRKHASNDGIASYIKDSCIGFLIEEELTMLTKAISKPKKPFVAIIGGVKVSDKMGAINNFAKIANKILIGGAMAYTFLKAKGHDVGLSLVEDSMIDTTKKLMKQLGSKLELPFDYYAAKVVNGKESRKYRSIEKGLAGLDGMDIGPKTAKKFRDIIINAKTVVWNGPMGVFEKPQYAKGTKKVAKAVVKATKNGAYTVIGGGDSAAAVKKFGYSKKVSFVSTGGGASLTFFNGEPLVGIDRIKTKKK